MLYPTQVMEELKNLERFYDQELHVKFDMLALSLSSRKNLCINEEVGIVHVDTLVDALRLTLVYALRYTLVYALRWTAGSCCSPSRDDA